LFLASNPPFCDNVFEELLLLKKQNKKTFKKNLNAKFANNALEIVTISTNQIKVWCKLFSPFGIESPYGLLRDSNEVYSTIRCYSNSCSRSNEQPCVRCRDKKQKKKED
jgi:hypothetical protein